MLGAGLRRGTARGMGPGGREPGKATKYPQGRVGNQPQDRAMAGATSVAGAERTGGGQTNGGGGSGTMAAAGAGYGGACSNMLAEDDLLGAELRRDIARSAVAQRRGPGGATLLPLGRAGGGTGAMATTGAGCSDGSPGAGGKLGAGHLQVSVNTTAGRLRGGA